MALTWKDFVTTILAAVVFGLYYAMTKGIAVPLIPGYRAAMIVLFIIGISMCAFSSASNASPGNLFITTASILGAASLILIIYGLITGAKLAFTLIAAAILLLWIIATARHILGA